VIDPNQMHPTRPPLLWEDVEEIELSLIRALREAIGDAVWLACDAEIRRAVRQHVGRPLAQRFFP